MNGGFVAMDDEAMQRGVETLGDGVGDVAEQAILSLRRQRLDPALRLLAEGDDAGNRHGRAVADPPLPDLTRRVAPLIADQPQLTSREIGEPHPVARRPVPST